MDAVGGGVGRLGAVEDDVEEVLDVAAVVAKVVSARLIGGEFRGQVAEGAAGFGEDFQVAVAQGRAGAGAAEFDEVVLDFDVAGPGAFDLEGGAVVEADEAGGQIFDVEGAVGLSFAEG